MDRITTRARRLGIYAWNCPMNKDIEAFKGNSGKADDNVCDDNDEDVSKKAMSVSGSGGKVSKRQTLACKVIETAMILLSIWTLVRTRPDTVIGI